MRSRQEATSAADVIGQLRIKTASDALGVANLSGGNQQKVVLGKWFMINPGILLLDEPTRGVDVGAKREIYRVISDFARAGGAVIMVSSETDEILGMADRVIVLKDGRKAGELARDKLSAEELLHLAA
jgi:putative xylitol transport system ATP-binding protein